MWCRVVVVVVALTKMPCPRFGECRATLSFLPWATASWLVACGLCAPRAHRHAHTPRRGPHAHAPEPKAASKPDDHARSPRYPRARSPRPAPPAPPLPAVAIIHVLSYLDLASDVGPCAAVDKGWVQASYAPSVWRALMQVHCLDLATVVPLIASHIEGEAVAPDGRLQACHPKRLLKEHWQTVRDRHDSEDAEADNAHARASKEVRHCEARFRDCFIHVSLTDADTQAPFLF